MPDIIRARRIAVEIAETAHDFDNLSRDELINALCDISFMAGNLQKALADPEVVPSALRPAAIFDALASMNAARLTAAE